jgi:hypothetical protein
MPGAQANERQRRDVDSPERTRGRFDRMDDGRPDEGGVRDGEDPPGRPALPVEPGRRPFDQCEDRFAAMRRASRITQPFGDGVRFFRAHLIKRASRPPTVIAIAQHRLNGRVEREAIGCLTGAQCRARPTAVCTAEAKRRRGQLLPRLRVDRFVGRKRRCAHCRRRGVANQSQAGCFGHGAQPALGLRRAAIQPQPSIASPRPAKVIRLGA